jgi:hypothetical protein
MEQVHFLMEKKGVYNAVKLLVGVYPVEDIMVPLRKIQKNRYKSISNE